MTNDEKERTPIPECMRCGGSGKERCDNPDHEFIEAAGGEVLRLGCPSCGHDPDHMTEDPCCICGLGGRDEKIREEERERIRMVLIARADKCEAIRAKAELSGHDAAHDDMVSRKTALMLAAKAIRGETIPPGTTIVRVEDLLEWRWAIAHADRRMAEEERAGKALESIERALSEEI